MKYTIYPGCVSHQTCPELLNSTRTVLQALDIELVDVKGFVCCGAGYLNISQDALEVAVNAQNFALAGKEDAAIITSCSSCYLTMKKAEKSLENPSLKEEIDGILKNHGLDAGRLGKVYHLLEVLTEGENFNKISNSIRFPLEGINVAPFYGCHLIRPKGIVGDISGATRMDSLIEETGATLVHCSSRFQCCGFHVQLENEKAMASMAAEFLAEARDRGSDLVLTSCPLCQMTFDMFRAKIKKKAGGKLDIPVLHLAQLVGLSLGTGAKAVGLGKNLVSPQKVFSKAIRKGVKT